MMVFTTKRLDLFVDPLDLLDQSLLHCLLFALLLLLQLRFLAGQYFWCFFYLLTHQHSLPLDLFSLLFFLLELLIKHTHDFLTIDAFVNFGMDNLQFSYLILFDCFSLS